MKKVMLALCFSLFLCRLCAAEDTIGTVIDFLHSGAEINWEIMDDSEKYSVIILEKEKKRINGKKIVRMSLLGKAMITKSKILYFGIALNKKDEKMGVFIILEGKEHWSSLVTINELDSFSNFTKKQKVTFLISLFPFLQEFYPSLPVAIINSAEPGRIENR